jgi:hypothetical protein
MRSGVAKGQAERQLKRDASVWLVGYPEMAITGTHLPSKRKAYLYFRYLKQQAGDPMKATIRLRAEDKRFERLNFNQILATKTIGECLTFWRKGPYDVKDDVKCRDEILKIHKTWMELSKSKNNDSSAAEQKWLEFQRDLDTLLDLNPPDWKQRVLKSRSKATADEDITYMEACINGQKTGGIGAKDLVFEAAMSRKRERIQKFTERKEKSDEEIHQLYERIGTTTSDETHEPAGFSGWSPDDQDFQAPSSSKRKAKPSDVTITLPRTVMKSPIITNLADRHRLSNRQLAATTAALLKIGGATASDVVLSESTMKRSRDLNRETEASRIKDKFKFDSKDLALTLHWDEKLMKMASGDNKEQLAILVSGFPLCVEGKLLGAFPIESGTGFSMARKTIDILVDWDLTEHITALSFDTTSSNTGHIQGAATRIEEELNRKLFWLACRHHVAELILGSSWCEMFGRTTSKDNLLFKRFQECWNTLDKSDFHVLDWCDSDPFVEAKRKETVDYLRQLLTHKNSRGLLPRDDYREAANLGLLMLGDAEMDKFNFLRPRGVPSRPMDGSSALWTQDVRIWQSHGL